MPDDFFFVCTPIRVRIQISFVQYWENERVSYVYELHVNIAFFESPSEINILEIPLEIRPEFHKKHSMGIKK